MERTIVVTGAGSGIGQATAIEVAGLGFAVVATVHHGDQIDHLERRARTAGARLAVEMSRRGGDPQEVATTIGAVLHAGRPRFRYRVGRGSNALPLVGKVLPTSVRDRLSRPVAGL